MFKYWFLYFIIIMSTEFERIQKEKKTLENELEMLDFEEETLREKMAEMPTLVCDNCEDNRWHVQADYDPWGMMAYESRNIILTCKGCDAVFFIKVQRDY